MSGRKYDQELIKVGDRRILAYHVEVWGNDSMIVQKDWSAPDANADERWWENY